MAATPRKLYASNDTLLLDTISRQATHEEVCALRYLGINSRLKRLENILIAGGGAIILLLANIALKAH